MRIAFALSVDDVKFKSLEFLDNAHYLYLPLLST